MIAEEKTIKTERIFEGRIINLRVDTVELPDKKYSKREIIEHPGAVGIIAITSDNKMVFVRQFRKAIESDLLEIPAGKIEEKEDPMQCAIRELEEETGYITSKAKKILDFYTTPGFSNEIIHIYLTKDLIVGNPNPEKDEYIEVVTLSIEEALGKIQAGEIKDGKTIIAILTYYNMNNQ